MTKYYLRSEKKDSQSTIYFNFQKKVPHIRFRVCTHIKIDNQTWEAANKNATAWNKFTKSNVGKPIVEKLELMQQTVSELYAIGEIKTNDDKWKVDNAIEKIVNAEAIRIKEEEKQKAMDEEKEIKKRILPFYENILEGIVSGDIRHGNNKVYTKSSIGNWNAFGKYLRSYCKATDTFDDITKSYADKFCAFLDRKKLMPTTCNKYIICFRRLCNLAAEYGVNHNATSLKVWKEHDVHENEKRAEIYLTEEELDSLYAYPLHGEEEQARDLFILGYLSCQRFSDYNSLSQANFGKTASGTPVIKIQQIKTGNYVEVPIIDERVECICDKYDYHFPKITSRKINDLLLSAMKKVAKVCPSLMEKYVTSMTLQERRREKRYHDLLEMESAHIKFCYEDKRAFRKMKEYAIEHNGQPLYERNEHGDMVKYKYELVTSHTARRSGVTNLYKTGLLDTREMMAISGHQTETIFEHYIKMSKSEHADRIATKLRSKVKNH